MNYSFLQTEWFYTAGTMFFMVIIWKIDYFRRRRELKDEKEIERLSRLQETNTILKREFRANWAKIVAYPEESKDIFKSNYSDLQNEDLRTAIYHIVDILHDVFSNYEDQGFDISLSLWEKTFTHAFNPTKKKAIVDAYEKFKNEGQFSDSFVTYVDKVILLNKEKRLKQVA